MANRAFLIGGHDATPIGPTTEGYDPDQQVLCAASYQIPAFWLACFTESDLCEFVAEGERIPTAVTSAVAAHARLSERAPLVAEVFGWHADRWAEWVRFIGVCEFPYLTLDGYEVWAMGPDEFAAHLPRAIRWFSSRSPVDRSSLFWLAGIEQYDEARRAIVCGRDECPGRFLQGYGWVREVPWDE
jgi:hypothetical protein